ncbi:MAG: DUF1820 family protein [Proteobacteria bacterium]|nr:DUF1820 family protein [Pseudomonadota bacterium]
MFKVIFHSQGKVFEIYARKVGHGAMFGFIEVEELIFGERSSVVVDPSEEKIQVEFAGVKRTYLPLHSVIRIDEVPSQASARSGRRIRPQCRPVSVPHVHPRQAGPGNRGW